MQRILVTFFLILLAGCSTPSTTQNAQVQATAYTPTHSDQATELPQQAFTPTPSLPPVDVLQIATTYIPTLSGSLTVERQTVARIMLDEPYIYWAVDNQLDTIYRTPLNGGAVEAFITSKFEGGNVEAFPLSREKDWFVYLDHDNLRPDANWELRSKNIRDGSEKIILSGKGTLTSAFDLYVSVSNEWVAWSRLVPGSQGKCQESVLGLSNLSTNEQVELDRVCIDQFMWTWVDLSNGALIAERDYPDFLGGGHSLCLFNDVRNQQCEPLTDRNASMPSISSPWIVWKNGPRFEWGNSNSIYNMNDKTRREFIAPGESPPDPILVGQWLYWVNWVSADGAGANAHIFLYDLQRDQAWNIPPLGDGSFSDAAIDGQWIAWIRNSNYAGGDTVLEWAKLP